MSPQFGLLLEQNECPWLNLKQGSGGGVAHLRNNVRQLIASAAIKVLAASQETQQSGWRLLQKVSQGQDKVKVKAFSLSGMLLP